MKKNTVLFLLFFSFYPAFIFAQIIAGNTPNTILNDQINNLPVSFRKNMGQWDDKIIYQGFSPGWNANINFMKDGLSFGLSREVEVPVEKKNNTSEHKSLMDIKIRPHEHLIWNLYFKGMNSGVTVTPDGKQDSHINYLIGNDSSKWQINVPDYSVLNYRNVYDNIDIKYYSTGKNIKYDCMVKPGGDVGNIMMACRGIKHVKVNQKKQLEITNSWGTLIEEMPESYQIINDTKVLVAVEYVSLNDTTFGFRVAGKYDRSQTLVIDPVILAWGTFVGASGTDEGYSYAVAVDPAGNVYCTGFYEVNFPVTVGAFNTTSQSQQNVIVYKLNPTATTLLYGTYLGSSSNDWGYGIVVNAAGEAYVTGRAGAANFPTTPGAFQTVLAGSFDVFVTKLNATGTGLIYSTFIGGTNDDEGYDIKINAAGEAFVTGVASKAGFPYTAGAFQTTLVAGYGALVAKLNSTGTALIYAGILGGNLGNYGYGIAIDPAGNAYVTGETGSWANNPPTYTDFPLTPGAFDMNYGNCGWKGFITKINAAGTSIVYSSLLGGQGNCPQTGADRGHAVAVNAAGEAFVVGNTASSNFYTTPGAFDQTYGGSAFMAGDGFVIRLNASGTGAIYSTFYGGSGGDEICGVVVNSANEAFISGYTETDDGTFPVTSCAYQPIFGGQSTATPRGDIFVAKFNALGTTLQYSTFVGGNSDDYQIPKIVLFGACEEEVIVNGTSHSANFPTTPGVFQPTKLNGGNDQHIVFKMKTKVDPNFTFIKTPCSKTVTFTDSSTGNCIWQNGPWTPSSWNWNFGDGSTSTLQNPVHTYTAYGTYSVTLVVSCPKDSITIPITISNTNGSVSGNTTICQGNSATLSATGGTNYSWNTGATTSSISVTPSTTTNYTVIITSGACADTIPLSVSVGSSVSINSGVTPASCNGGNNGTSAITVSGGTAPYTYSWSPSGGTNATATGLSAGNYTVTVTDASGGCANTQTINISQPSALTTSVSSTPAACGGNSGTATVAAAGGSGSYTYNWNPSGQTSQIASNLLSGNYSITITDANGCTIDTTVTVAATGSITATASNSTICAGQNATLNASGGTNYSWSNGSTTASINVSPVSTTTFSVIVSSGTCSVSVTSTVVVNSVPSVSASGSTTISMGSSTTLSASGGGIYSWSNGANGSLITVSPPITTTYCVFVANGNCSDSACVTVFVEPLDCSPSVTGELYLPNAFSPNNDGENDILRTYFGNYVCIKTFELRIYDRWGEKVFETTNPIAEWDGYYKGKPEGTAVFVYYMTATLITGEQISKKGNISLMR